VKNKKNSHARQEISNRKNGKSTRISLNWWILYVHYNLKFKAVGFSVPSHPPKGNSASAFPAPGTHLPSEQRQHLRASPRQNLPFAQLQPPPHTAILNSRVLP